jgi:hypothetical protein
MLQRFNNPMVTKSDGGFKVYKEILKYIVPENVKMEVGDKVSYSQMIHILTV